MILASPRTNSFGPVELEAGRLWYTYPDNNGASDQELYVTVSYDNLIVTPVASAFWNYSDSAGTDVSEPYRVECHRYAKRSSAELIAEGAIS